MIAEYIALPVMVDFYDIYIIVTCYKSHNWGGGLNLSFPAQI